VSFASGRTIRADTVIATDGAGSAVRQSMERDLADFQSSSVFLEHGYKELHIPPSATGNFQLEKNALHIWPRHKFMMIALPNFDGGFTCTLFLANKGENSFEEISRGFAQIDADQKEPEHLRHLRLSAAESVLEFFNREFPDAVPLMPTLVEDFFTNPTGNLGTLKCWPWNVEGRALLLGDSAHAVVPFYGQGMNCAFEDVRILDSLLSEPGAVATGSAIGSEPTASAGGQIDWATVYEKYGQLRKKNTDAIADMAEENFYEMRDATADPVFQRKRELETKLEQMYPDYFSKYSMVTFREDLPYSVAKQKGNAQDKFLMEVCSTVDSTVDIDVNGLIERIRSEDF
ncbi:MAG: hypothetical protein HOP17_05885, partial [Acidobacteria bacterium]|nr:hypothetical protein [Acidobacteriota bacterium]